MRLSLQIIAAIGMAVAIIYLAVGLRYPFGTLQYPGPGCFPLIAGSIMLVGCLGTLVEASCSKRTEKTVWPRGPSRTRLLSMLTVISGSVIVLPYIGYVLSSMIVTLIILQIMGYGRWPVKVGLAVGIGLGSYIILKYLLGIQLPLGIFFD